MASRAEWATVRPADTADPADRVTLDESVNMAFLVVLESMTPAERVAFILHDVSRYPFADVAEIGLLDPNATATADGGGRAVTFLHPIEGGERIARAWVEIANRAASGMSLLERTVNGQPGLVAWQDGSILTVFAFDVAGDRIKHIWAVRNPEKLRSWPAG